MTTAITRTARAWAIGDDALAGSRRCSSSSRRRRVVVAVTGDGDRAIIHASWSSSCLTRGDPEMENPCMLPSSNPVVLVADDEPSMLELVSRHLRTMDDPKLEVLEASDGEQAWSLAREHLPDLVVLDVMMPGMSGWEVCRKIREDVALAHTGVVMLTGIGENLNQMTSPLYGADAYIDKPFEFEELDEKVKNALSARAAQRDAVARPVTTTVNGVSGPAQPAGKKAKASAKKSGRASAKKSASKSANKTAKKAAAKGARRTATKTAGRKGAANKPAAKKTTAKTKAGAKVTSTRKPQRGDTTMAAKKSAKKAAKKSTGAKKTAKKTAKKKAK